MGGEKAQAPKEGCERCCPGGALMRKVEEKLRELERELMRCKEEGDAAEKARKKHEAMMTQVRVTAGGGWLEGGVIG